MSFDQGAACLIDASPEEEDAQSHDLNQNLYRRGIAFKRVGKFSKVCPRLIRKSLQVHISVIAESGESRYSDLLSRPLPQLERPPTIAHGSEIHVPSKASSIAVKLLIAVPAALVRF